MTRDDYRAQLVALLPRGPAWDAADGGGLDVLLTAQAAGLARVDLRAADLVREVFPGTVYELLAEWESSVGLPDECTVPGGSLAERRAALAGKLAAQGGQSIAYYLGVLAALGFPAARISELRPCVHGRRYGARRYGAWMWGRVWMVHLPAVGDRRRRNGEPFGERYGYGGNAAVECVINRIKPAHTIVLFAYGD